MMQKILFSESMKLVLLLKGVKNEHHDTPNDIRDIFIDISSSLNRIEKKNHDNFTDWLDLFTSLIPDWSIRNSGKFQNMQLNFVLNLNEFGHLYVCH